MKIEPRAYRSFAMVLALSLLGSANRAFAQQWQAEVTVNWDKVERVSRTTPTYQIVESARLRPASPIHDRVYRNLHDLGAEYVRFQGWFPFPKLAVAELEPPSGGKTFWDLPTWIRLLWIFWKPPRDTKLS